MVTFTINFQSEGMSFNLKLFIEVISCLPILFRDKILKHGVKIDQNALDSMAVSPDRENVSIFENYSQLNDMLCCFWHIFRFR